MKCYREESGFSDMLEVHLNCNREKIRGGNAERRAEHLKSIIFLILMSTYTHI